MINSFKITAVTRDDLKAVGIDGDKFDDFAMERLASKMADDYVNQMFWISLEILGKYILEEIEGDLTN